MNNPVDSAPKVSIIITSYNRAQMIGKAIKSALDQDYENLEIIISDNCSTDDSDLVIKKYADDPRMIYRRNERNVGMLNNFKIATEQLATGSLVTYVSSDDWLTNNSFITDAVNAFNKYKSLKVYSGLSRNYFLSTGTEAHNTSYPFKLEHNFFNRLIPGREMFEVFPESHLLNFGGSVYFRDDLIKLNIFREANTTYFDLQAILLLAMKGDFYLSDANTYMQVFHSTNASQAVAGTEQALANLSFAEIPYQEAVINNFIPAEQLEQWLHKIIRLFVWLPLQTLYKDDKPEYRKFVKAISRKYPAVYKEIVSRRRWKIFKIIYSNPLFAYLYKTINPLKHAS